MRVNVIKSFPYSVDGITPIQAVAGETADIPAELVAGLASAGFIKGAEPEKYETADAGESPENKMLDDPFATDNGECDPLKSARDEYKHVFGKRAYHGWDVETITDKVDMYNENKTQTE